MGRNRANDAVLINRVTSECAAGRVERSKFRGGESQISWADLRLVGVGGVAAGGGSQATSFLFKIFVHSCGATAAHAPLPLSDRGPNQPVTDQTQIQFKPQKSNPPHGTRERRDRRHCDWRVGRRVRIGRRCQAAVARTRCVAESVRPFPSCVCAY